MSSISFIESKLIRAHSASTLISPQTHILSKPPIKQIGNYSLGAEIGSGAFGKVILGHSLLTNDSVAIKILDKLILSQTPEDLTLVQKEISILKIVKHKYLRNRRRAIKFDKVQNKHRDRYPKKEEEE